MKGRKMEQEWKEKFDKQESKRTKTEKERDNGIKRKVKVLIKRK